MPEFDPNPPAYAVLTGAYPTNTMDVGAIDRAGTLTIEGQQKDAHRPVQEPEKTLGDVFTASFRTGTSIGSLLAQANAAHAPSADNPTLTASEAYDRAVKDGLGHYAERIASWASTEADYQNLARQAKQEQTDAQTLAAAGKIGHAIAFGAGLLDPVNYVPVIGVAGRAARAGSMARTALNAAEAGMVSTAASEAIQSAASVTKTPQESAVNIAFGTAFSAVLGSAVHKMVGHDASVKIEDRAKRAADPAAVAKEVDTNLKTTRETTGIPDPVKKVDTLPDTITPDNVDAHYDAVAARFPKVMSEVPKDTGAAEFAAAIEKISQPDIDGIRMYEPWTPPVFDGSRQLAAVILPDGTKFRAEHSQFYHDAQTGAFGPEGGRFAERAVEVTMYGNGKGEPRISFSAREDALTSRQLSEIRKMYRDAGVDLRDVRFEILDDGKVHIENRHENHRGLVEENSKPFSALSESLEPSPNSAGAGSALTREQRAEVSRIQRDFPDMDQADIIDSVLASHGELSLNKYRPGLDLVPPARAEAPQPKRVRAADLEANELTRAILEQQARQGIGFSELWSKAVDGTTAIKELIKLVPMHLKGKLSYSDLAEHLTNKFGLPFTRGAVSGAIRDLRAKGVFDKVQRQTPSTHYEPVITPENVKGWLHAAGVEDVEVLTKTNNEGGKTRYLKFTDPSQPKSIKQNVEVRIPDDGHPGRAPNKNERGSMFDTGAGHRKGGGTGSPRSTENASGGKFDDWDNLIDALKWRLARSPDGQFLVAPGREPNMTGKRVGEKLPEMANAEYAAVNLVSPDQLTLPFGVDHIKANIAARAHSVGAEATEFEGLSSSSRLDTRFLGLDPVAMLKKGNKVFTSAPIRGAAGIAAKGAEWLGIPAKALKNFAESPVGENIVSQGMRHPFFNLQSSASPAARSYASKGAIAGDPIFMKTDAAGIVTHGDNNFTEHFLPIHTEHVEATRIADETWRKHRGELKNQDGSPMSREDYAREVSIATIEDGRHDNPIIATAAKSVRKVFDAALKKFNEADVLDPGKQVRNAETYAPIVYLPDAVRNDRGGFIEQHTQDFTNRFEADYGKALTAKKDNDRTMKAAVEGLQKQVDDKIKSLTDALRKDVQQRKDEHGKRVQDHADAIDLHRQVLKADRADELTTLAENAKQKREEAAAKRDEALQAAQDRADARGSKDANRGEMSDHSARALEEKAQAASDKALAQEQARAHKAYETEINRLDPENTKSKYTIEKRKIDRSYDAEEKKLDLEATSKKKDFEQRRDDELKAERETFEENVQKEKDRVDEEKAKFKDKLSEYDQNVLRLNTPAKRADKAREMAEHHYTRVTNNSSGVLLDADLPRGLTGFGQVLEARTTATAHLTQLEKGWVEPNIFRSMDQYVRRAGTAAAMANTFKREVKIPRNELTEGGPTHRYVGDPGARSVRAEIGTDFDELIKHAGEKSTAAEKAGDIAEKERHTAVETSLTNQKKQAIDDFDTLHGMRMGDHGGGDNSIDIGSAGPLLQIFNNLRFMGGTVAASIGDPINAVIAHGFANTMKYGFIPVAKNFKQAWLNVAAEELPDHLRILQMTGAATEHVLNSRLAAATDMGNPGASKTMNVANLANKQFWRITGLSGWTNVMKDITGLVTHGRLIEHSQRGWENLSVGERTWLTNLKIGEAELGRVAEMHAEQTAAGHGTSAGVPYARTRDLSAEGRGDYTGWSDRGIAAKVEAAVFRESHNVAVTPTADDKLALTATPVGRFLWQYRNFGVAMTGRVIGRNAALAGIDDAARMNFYTGVAGMVMAGVMVDFFKTMAGEATQSFSSKNHPDMWAAEVWAKKWQTDPGAQMYHALDRSAIVWPIMEASNILHTMGLPNLESGIGKLTGDKSQENPGRFGHRGVVEAALGPSIGLLSDLPGAIKDIGGFAGYEAGLNPDWKYNKSAFQRDRRLLPLQNTVPFQQMLNYGHQTLGTHWNWPEPK